MVEDSEDDFIIEYGFGNYSLPMLIESVFDIIN
jgi:hypothetical protein